MKAKDKYKKIKRLGKGSFGKVYLVECPTKNKLFAIKTVNMDELPDQELADALQEAKVMPTLNHPNIIHFEDCFVMKQPKLSLCIVMEYADGEDLKKKIANQRKLKKFFSENQILDWFTQICLGLKHLHDRKILHRDLKSENIFLTKNNIIKLGDFGVCKCLDYTLQKATTEIGTPYYISPEIILGDSYSFPTDIWSLGVILYELCSLKLPFEGRNRPELNANIIRGRFSDVNCGYSNDLRMLLRNLLSVKEEKRLRIHDILKLPIIHNRIKAFLSEVDYNEEFSHTILHNYNPLADSFVDDKLMDTSASKEYQKKSSNESNGDIIEFTKTLNKEKPSNKQDAEDYLNAHKIFIELNQLKKEAEQNNTKEGELKNLAEKIESLEIDNCKNEQLSEPIKLEEVRNELEKLYGKNLFLKVCHILDENVSKSHIIFEREKITKIMIENLRDIDSNIANSIVSRIHEFFNFVIESRMKNYK